MRTRCSPWTGARTARPWHPAARTACCGCGASEGASAKASRVGFEWHYAERVGRCARVSACIREYVYLASACRSRQWLVFGRCITAGCLFVYALSLRVCSARLLSLFHAAMLHSMLRLRSRHLHHSKYRAPSYCLCVCQRFVGHLFTHVHSQTPAPEWRRLVKSSCEHMQRRS